MKDIPCVDSCLFRLGFLCLMCNASFMLTSKSLLAESITICLFSKEVDFLRDIFWKNGYPKELFDSCLRRFLNHKHARDNSEAKVEYDKS